MNADVPVVVSQAKVHVTRKKRNAYLYSTSRRESTRQESAEPHFPENIYKVLTVVRAGEKSLLCDPESELQL